MQVRLRFWKTPSQKLVHALSAALRALLSQEVGGWGRRSVGRCCCSRARGAAHRLNGWFGRPLRLLQPEPSPA